MPEDKNKESKFFSRSVIIFSCLYIIVKLDFFIFFGENLYNFIKTVTPIIDVIFIFYIFLKLSRKLNLKSKVLNKNDHNELDVFFKLLISMFIFGMAYLQFSFAIDGGFSAILPVLLINVFLIPVGIFSILYFESKKSFFFLFIVIFFTSPLYTLFILLFVEYIKL